MRLATRRLATLLFAILVWQQAAPAAGSDSDPLIAFCRPMGSAGRPACACSVEQVEDLITPDRFLDHLRELRAAYAASAAELRLAMLDLRAACPTTEPGGAVASATRMAVPAGGSR